MAYYYLVAPAVLVRADEPAFTYKSPTPLAIGTIVRISVGSRITNGLVLQNVAKPKFSTKDIVSVIYSNPLPQPILQLCSWMSDYYAAHLATVLQTVLPAGLQRNRRATDKISTYPLRKRTKIVLNSEQLTALRALQHDKSGTVLLHGVTGSGKTQVYIEAAKHQARQNKSSIILVPEIALTPQLVAEFANHFQNLIVTHSSLTEAERHKAWLKALDSADTPTVVIGPRSALFTPINNVGLIVLDECHEPSYKQEQAPRYSALRAASKLASFHKDCRLILGSATPSITDYYFAQTNKSPIVRLTKPAVAGPPVEAKVVDIKDRSSFRRHRFFSDPLLNQIEQALLDNRQVLLFHNRRGTSPTTMCDHCGWLAECPACFLPLTLHADQHVLRCHICGRVQLVLPSCPACGEPTIVFKGIGTKLIESEITKIFSKANVARFDADTTPAEAVHNRYQELYDGQINILIGTQMLAKGLDLPNLTTVGIIQADSGLILPDYQADERVFQLLYQVMGRVGRGQLPGKVIVQSYQPDHPIIKAALARNYQSFYNAELNRRRAGHFPPFRFLLKLSCSYKTEAGAVKSAQKMAKQLRKQYHELEILGPSPAFYERQGGKFKWQLIVKSKQRKPLVDIATSLPAHWQADLDPASLL